MHLPSLKIGNLIAKVPVIQGGMGVGVSLSSLAAAVANEGGIGIISGVQNGFKEADFRTNNLMANLRAMNQEIRRARELSPKGIIGINIMTAATQYKELVEEAVKEKIDIIIAGAGLPKDLPKYVKGSNTKAIPVVSSGKAAKIITKLWIRNYDYLPDAIVVEGPEAGGHLGFSNEEIVDPNRPKITEILKDVLKEIIPFETQYNKKIPVIVAGGVFTGRDIVEHIKNGASGVQMSTRFVATKECDASMEFKEAYVKAKEEDVMIVKSPVGMPGRAIRTPFSEQMENERVPIKTCYNCLTPCEPKSAPYCISDALINAVKGDVENGLVFCGSNVSKVTEITTVKEVFNRIIQEAEEVE